MIAAPCALPRPGLSFPSAPEKRQIERLAVPESDGFFTPEIRPDSGRCSSQSPQCWGWRDARHRKAARRSQSRFLRPASSRRQAGSILEPWRLKS